MDREVRTAAGTKFFPANVIRIKGTLVDIAHVTGHLQGRLSICSVAVEDFHPDCLPLVVFVEDDKIVQWNFINEMEGDDE